MLRTALIALLLTFSVANDIEQKRPVATILIEGGSGRHVRLAAAELRRYLSIMHVPSEARATIVESTHLRDVMLNSSGLVVAVVSQANTIGVNGYMLFAPRDGAVMISGSDELHALYGVYTLLEAMGCTFSTAGPTTPVSPSLHVFEKGWSQQDTPVFTTRGLQPFHDFAEGPDWWSADELARVMESIISMKGNMIAFHTYPLEEPAVWVGLNTSVSLPSGNITIDGAYPTRWATTLGACCGGWGYNPMESETLGYGAGQIFEHSCFGHPTVSGDSNLCPRPQTPADSVEVFNRVGLHWQRAFKHAKSLGLSTVLGTEMPLSLPPLPPQPTVALQLWYSPSRDDHFVTATNCDECENLYNFMGIIGWVYTEPQPGSVPLYTYYNGVTLDNMLSNSSTAPSGYALVRTEGYAPPPTSNGTTNPLMQYYNSVTSHHWAVTAGWVENATAAGFKDTGTMGFVFTTGPLPTSNRSALDYYIGAFTRLKALYGDTLTHYWSWTPEAWEWNNVPVTDPLVQDAVRDSELLQQAYDFVKPNFTLATCGWVVGPVGARWYYDTKLPASWAMSSIDMNVGNTPVDPAYANITHRSTANKWAIPWAEDDPGLTAPELWVNRSLEHARQALNYSVGGLLSIHWRTRATSPQIGSAHAVAWNISLTSIDYWSKWAIGQFGDANIAATFAAVLNAKDSFNLPRPVQWVGGPGGFVADAATCNWQSLYTWVDELAALRPALVASIAAGSATLDNLERFDYWVGQFIYARSIAVFECDWAAYDATIKAIKAITDPTQRTAAARAIGIPARIRLQANATEVVQNLLATVSTIEGSGTVYNVISHGLWGALGPVATADLITLAGMALPPEAFASNGYSPQRPPQLRVQVMRSMLASDETLNIRAVLLAAPEQAPLSVMLYTSPAGPNPQWSAMPLKQAAAAGGLERFVFTAEFVPPADIQWYIVALLPPNTTAYTQGLGLPAGTIVGTDAVRCFVPPGGDKAPQTVVIVPT